MLPSDLILVGKCLYFVLCNGNFKDKIDIFQRELSNKLCCGLWSVEERSSIYPALIHGRFSITVSGVADWHARTVEGSLVVAQGGTICAVASPFSRQCCGLWCSLTDSGAVNRDGEA